MNLKNILFTAAISVVIVFAFDLIQNDSKFSTQLEKTLTEKPEMVISAIENYQKNQHEKAMEEIKNNTLAMFTQLTEDSDAPFLGNPKGSKVMVLFTEPRCPHCVKFHNTLDVALDQDKDLKVYVIDYPIFGGVSDELASAAIAAHKQGKYKEANSIIYTKSPKSFSKFANHAKKQGIDINKLKQDMKSTTVQDRLKNHADLGDKLGVNATPYSFLKDRAVAGALSLEDLKEILS